MPVIRVSEAAKAALQRRAAEEGRTVVAVVDRLLGVQGRAEALVSAVAPKVMAPSVERAAVVPVGSGLCVCGHAPGMHRELTKGCTHLKCYPNGCRGFREA